MIVYCVLNRITGRFYIGKTTKLLRSRWIEHLCDARKGSKLPLHRAIRKYGEKAFERVVISHAESVSQLDDMEKFFIEKYQGRRLGYNCTAGGDGATPGCIGPNRGKKFSKEWKKNLSLSHKGKKLSESNRQKLRAALTGRVVSRETRDKLRQAAKEQWANRR